MTSPRFRLRQAPADMRRRHEGHALHRARRWERARPDGDDRPAGRSVGPNEASKSSWNGPRRFRARSREPAGSATTTSSRSGSPSLASSKTDGWNTHQFHAATEFYSDFGVYDVQPHAARAASSSAPPGAADRRGRRTPTARRLTAIRTKTSTTSPGRRARTSSTCRSDSSTRRCRRVDIRLLLQPEHRRPGDRYFAIVSATLKRYGEWFGPYPYGHLTIVDPAFQSDSDGMEYPTLVTGRSRWLTPAKQPDAGEHDGARGRPSVVVRAWWRPTSSSTPGWTKGSTPTPRRACSRKRSIRIASSRDTSGRSFHGRFATYPSRAIDNDRLAGYRLNSEADAQWTPTLRYWPSTAAIISYNKTALWLHTLERRLGWPMMQRILSTYFERWKFKHPSRRTSSTSCVR